MQVLLADLMIHPADPTLYQAPESINRIRVDVAHDVDFGAVIDAPVCVLIAVTA